MPPGIEASRSPVDADADDADKPTAHVQARESEGLGRRT